MPHIKGNKILPYNVSEIFNIALDLERYPEFIPYIKSTHIIEKNGNIIKALITLRLGIIGFSYECEIEFKEYEYMKITTKDKNFSRFSSFCSFRKISDAITEIDYELDSNISNQLFESLSNILLPFYYRSTVKAFENQLNSL